MTRLSKLIELEPEPNIKRFFEYFLVPNFTIQIEANPKLSEPKIDQIINEFSNLLLNYTIPKISGLNRVDTWNVYA